MLVMGILGQKKGACVMGKRRDTPEQITTSQRYANEQRWAL
jgi:hypothetical protein